jgi:hypothetical protein
MTDRANALPQEGFLSALMLLCIGMRRMRSLLRVLGLCLGCCVSASMPGPLLPFVANGPLSRGSRRFGVAPSLWRALTTTHGRGGGNGRAGDDKVSRGKKVRGSYLLG